MKRLMFIAFAVALMSFLIGATRTTTPVTGVESQAIVLKREAAVPEWRSTGAEFVERANGDLTLAAALWTESNPHDAAAWVETFADPAEREQAVAAVATAWADRDPASSAQFLLERTEPGQAQDNAVVGIVQRLAFQEIAKAEAWAAEFPDELRERAMAQLERIRERTGNP